MLIALRKQIERLFDIELVRYIVSGAIAFICDFSLLIFLTEVLGVHYLISNVAGYAVGLVVSYTINIKWVFTHRRFRSQQGSEFVYFTTIVVVGLAISELVIWLATDFIDLPYQWSKIISTCFVFVFNFVAKKWLLFSPSR
jgi:putative flippase GtrA